MTTEQAYCDWRFGPVDSVGRQRSVEAGAGDQDVWACVKCIESGRLRQPPDSWDGDPADWPVKDIGSQ
ncbi:MAG: hypothetical protein ACYCXN_05015 [Acidimicrobiales bacterium]